MKAASTAAVSQSTELYLMIIGCSMSYDKVKALDNFSAFDWTYVPKSNDYKKATTGTTVMTLGWPGWKKYNSKWGKLDNVLADHPEINTILLEKCDHNNLPSAASDTLFTAGQHIIEQLSLRVDTSLVKIYVTGQHPYEEGHVCTIAGEEGPAEMQQVADSLIHWGLAYDPRELWDPAQAVWTPLSEESTKSDGCHYNTTGLQIAAENMDSLLVQIDNTF